MSQNKDRRFFILIDTEGSACEIQWPPPGLSQVPSKLKTLQTLVGGLIEPIHTGIYSSLGFSKEAPAPGRREFVIIVNEEGILLGLPLNKLTTKLYGPLVLCVNDYDPVRHDFDLMPITEAEAIEYFTTVTARVKARARSEFHSVPKRPAPTPQV